MRCLLLLFLLFALPAAAQTATDDSSRAATLVREGIRLHDAEKYEDALLKYAEAARLDPSNEAVAYETAYTYSAMGRSKEALRYAEQAIKEGGRFAGDAYMLKGNLLDGAGRYDDAVRTYKQGLRNKEGARGHYLLHYNLALAHYNHRAPGAAVPELLEAVLLQPAHASSHLLLGSIMAESRQRIPAVLALYHFLLLEPDTKRSPGALALLDRLLSQGVTQESENQITIRLAAPEKKDPFSSMEMMMSMMSASLMGKDNKGKSEAAQFAEITDLLFGMLSGLEKEKSARIWWTVYGILFTAMNGKDHTEAFSYYIRQSEAETNVPLSTWLQTNEAAVKDLVRWYNARAEKD